MKNLLRSTIPAILVILSLSALLLTNCSEEEDPVKYPQGEFPDSIIWLEGINSSFDDYNSTCYQLTGGVSLIFSSNRKSSGTQFDLEQGFLTFTFDQTTGEFDLSSVMTQDPLLGKLITTMQTPFNDFGPYRTYSALDGYEYLIVASENAGGNLDLRYCKNLPKLGSAVPEVLGPYPITLLNTESDDAYLSFDLNLDSAYFASNPASDYDIYVELRPEAKDIGEWFDSEYSAAVKVDSINSEFNDVCPMVYNKVMIFTSDRPGGYGGYDLYYSLFRNGKWGSPVNMGSGINTSSDEYRPLIGYWEDFTNIYIIFSSNRPGGLGGFDLYFTGFDVP